MTWPNQLKQNMTIMYNYLPCPPVQAPSTSLCISILNLHSNGRECGRLILGLCDTLSCLLKPLAPGVPNPEVDYNLIMR